MSKINFVLSYKDKNNKMYAISKSVDTSVNLCGLFEKHEQLGDLEFMLYSKSKKHADEVARLWNYTFKQNGCLQEF